MSKVYKWYTVYAAGSRSLKVNTLTIDLKVSHSFGSLLCWNVSKEQKLNKIDTIFVETKSIFADAWQIFAVFFLHGPNISIILVESYMIFEIREMTGIMIREMTGLTDSIIQYESSVCLFLCEQLNVFLFSFCFVSHFPFSNL